MSPPFGAILHGGRGSVKRSAGAVADGAARRDRL